MTTGYLENLKAEMEARLGCGIEIVEDGDPSYPLQDRICYYATWAKVFPDKLDMLGLPYKKAYESAVAMMGSL